MVPFAPRRVAAALVLAAACYFLFFHNLTGVGLLGPDEPRYASIGREMARSGDWLTPRLWGQPWFEKPPLVYWMIAAGFRAGLSEDLAPRLPVAIVSVLFLLFYWRVLRREFGQSAALFATAILSTSAAWLGFSHIGVTDLPMAAAFSAAMLLSLRWIADGDRRVLTPAAALLGLAVLAKGLVPLVLAAPLVWAGRRRWRDLPRPVPIVVFLGIAAPWYIAITLRYGSRFVNDFFLKQHFARFATESLKHGQPFWFYVPVFLAALFPWSPLIALLFRRKLYQDPRTIFLLLWVGFGFVFFSAASNKLPGYLLPLLPAVSALAGIRLAQAPKPRVLIVCALLLLLVPGIAAVLPGALSRGITHTGALAVSWPVLLPFAALAGAVWVVIRRGKPEWAALAVAAGAAAGALWLETCTFPLLDRTVSARAIWREAAPHRDDLCVGEVNRGWRYGLNYYSGTPLPGCEAAPRRLRIEQPKGGAPYLALTSLRDF